MKVNETMNRAKCSRNDSKKGGKKKPPTVSSYLTHILTHSATDRIAGGKYPLLQSVALCYVSEMTQRYNE